MSTTVSRVELVRNQILSALRSIDQEHGYRTTPREVFAGFRDPEVLSGFPSVSLMLGEERISRVNSTWTTTTSRVQAYVFGYYRREADGSVEEAGEALIQDVKRVLWRLFAAQRNDPANPWVFDLNQSSVIVRRITGPDQDWGVFGIEFGIILRNQDEEF